MANETAAFGLGEGTTDEHNVLCVTWSQVGGKHLRAVCVFVRNFRAQQHILVEPNAQCILLKNTIKENVDDDPAQWLFLHRALTELQDEQELCS